MDRLTQFESCLDQRQFRNWDIVLANIIARYIIQRNALGQLNGVIETEVKRAINDPATYLS